MAKKKWKVQAPASPDSTASRRAVRVPISKNPVARQSALDFLGAVLKRESEFRDETLKAVKAARRKGATWEDISKVMGLSRASVHNRYSEATASVKRRSSGRPRATSSAIATRTESQKVVVES